MDDFMKTLLNKNTMKFSDHVYLSTGYIFTGLECGILTSYLFSMNSDQLEKIGVLELYIRLLLEICFMVIVLYFTLPFLKYFPSPLEGFYDYHRENKTNDNADLLFTVAYLIGSRSIAYKVTAILNKSGYLKIGKTLN